MYKVALFNKIPKESQSMLSENKYILVNEQTSEVDGIVMRSMDIHDMKFSRQLKAIARSGAGTNNIPVERCAEEGIVVFNSPGANANAVCELTFLGLLISSRKIVDSIQWTNNLKENVAVTVENGKSQFVGPEIKGKTLGVIGLGNVGHLVANLGIKLGMEVIGYDPYISVKNALSLSWDVQYSDSLDELYKRADYITIHVPLNDETRNYIHKDNIKLMKDGVKLLNFARDGLVNDEDILEALESSKVSYFVSDLPNERLIGVKNVVCIPHLGGSTPEAENNCAEMAVSQLTEYLEHGNIHNSVNFPECSMERYPNTKRIVVLNKNIPNMISTLTSVLAKYNINIIGMVNKSQDKYACNIIDVKGEITEEQLSEIENFPGILRVMLIK